CVRLFFPAPPVRHGCARSSLAGRYGCCPSQPCSLRFVSVVPLTVPGVLSSAGLPPGDDGPQRVVWSIHGCLPPERQVCWLCVGREDRSEGLLGAPYVLSSPTVT